MKRYILPLVLVIVGALLFIPYGIIERDPSTSPTGAQFCRLQDGVQVCDEGAYNSPMLTYSAWAVVAGVVLLPSGVAIGIYRLIKNSKQTTKKK